MYGNKSEDIRTFNRYYCSGGWGHGVSSGVRGTWVINHGYVVVISFAFSSDIVVFCRTRSHSRSRTVAVSATTTNWRRRRGPEGVADSSSFTPVESSTAECLPRSVANTSNATRSECGLVVGDRAA
jgi:hypothetical protein